jgi:HlyD family secretion protein
MSRVRRSLAAVFVGFNDWVKAGQPIAQLDQETFVARVNEAAAALKVAVASSRMEEAALERANVAVANAESAKKLAEDQTTAAKARQEELERDLQRDAGLARVDSISNRELTQARAQRDIGVADLRYERDAEASGDVIMACRTAIAGDRPRPTNQNVVRMPLVRDFCIAIAIE